MQSPKLIECRVRLTAVGVAITSPRTGRELAVNRDVAPQRIRGRITQAVSVGRRLVAFTSDELREFAAAARAA